jgi:L-asparagine transporter-like permease
VSKIPVVCVLVSACGVAILFWPRHMPPDQAFPYTFGGIALAVAPWWLLIILAVSFGPGWWRKNGR